MYCSLLSDGVDGFSVEGDEGYEGILLIHRTGTVFPTSNTPKEELFIITS